MTGVPISIRMNCSERRMSSSPKKSSSSLFRSARSPSIRNKLKNSRQFQLFSRSCRAIMRNCLRRRNSWKTNMKKPSTNLRNLLTIIRSCLRPYLNWSKNCENKGRKQVWLKTNISKERQLSNKSKSSLTYSQWRKISSSSRRMIKYLPWDRNSTLHARKWMMLLAESNQWRIWYRKKISKLIRFRACMNNLKKP